MSKNKEIALRATAPVLSSAYAKLLSQIRNQIKQAQEKIFKSVTREKVVMAWEIGKLVEEHLKKNDESGYGKRLIEQLARDTALADKVLYKMRSFFQTYPKLPKDDDRLNWTHYQKLSGVKKDEERKRLEQMVRENGWSTDALQEEVLKLKTPNGKGKFAKKVLNSALVDSTKKLKPERGKLFSYQLLKVADTDKTYVDLGFNILREAEEATTSKLKEASSVDVIKVNAKKVIWVGDHVRRVKSNSATSQYSLTESELAPRKFNTYKAYIERVVDGDTIRVTIDLGFKVLHKEILRLKGIDAPENGTDAGKKSAKALTEILKDVPFVVLKTMKIDIYGRYVADVFFDDVVGRTAGGGSKNKIDAQKVADEGIYLNQLLLDRGLVAMLVE